MELIEFLQSYEINDLETYKLYLNGWIVTRYLYKEGMEPIMSDADYTKYGMMFREISEINKRGDLTRNLIEYLEVDKIDKYIDVLYEEDEFPYEILKELGFDEESIDALRVKEVKYFSNLNFPEGFEEIEILPGHVYNSEYIKHLIADVVDEDPPKSIKPQESFRECYDWFNRIVGVDVCLSLKIDGINIRSFYINGHLALCCTRGRSGDIKDYTKALSWKVPLKLNYDGKPYNGIVRGELYVELDKLDYLRSKYKAEYVVPRTAATTMASVYHEEEDYKYLKYMTFNMTSTKELSSRIDDLKSLGFNSVPYIITRWRGGSYDTFVTWFKKVLEFMEGIEKDIGVKCDGLVAEINDRVEYEKRVVDGMYNEGNIAIKLGKWAPQVFEAKLVDFDFSRESASKEFSLVGVIEPTQVDGRLTVSRVNLFNWTRVVENDLNIGDTLKFYFKSGNSIDWIYSIDKITMKGEEL